MTGTIVRWYPARMRQIPATEASPPPPLRIAHVVDMLALAGMEYGVVKLVNRLDRARFRSIIVCMRHQRDDVRALLSTDVSVFEMRKQSGRNWRVIGRLAELFRSERIDIVHSHNWSTFLYAVLAARLARVPIGGDDRSEALRGELRLTPGNLVVMNTGGFRMVKDHATLLRASPWSTARIRVRGSS